MNADNAPVKDEVGGMDLPWAQRKASPPVFLYSRILVFFSKDRTNKHTLPYFTTCLTLEHIHPADNLLVMH